MDFSHPWSLVSGMVLGMVGMVFFISGKKNVNIPLLAIGAVMCVFPYFVESVAIQWAVGALCIFGGFKAMRAELA